MSSLFFPYKKELECYYGKYWRHDGNYLWMGNHPVTIFAEDYIKYGKEILENLDNHVFIKYEYDRYSKSPSVLNDTHKYKASQRIINMVDSVRKHGYCKGKFDKSKHLIRAYKANHYRYIKEEEVYVLKSKKHRASVCCALGKNKIRIKLVERPSYRNED